MNPAPIRVLWDCFQEILNRVAAQVKRTCIRESVNWVANKVQKPHLSQPNCAVSGVYAYFQHRFEATALLKK
jgi:hypothetical protein